MAALTGLLGHRADVAMKAKVEDLNQDLWRDGTGNQSKDILGFAAAIPSDPTIGTYGSVSRANTAWRSQTFDNATTAADVITDLRRVLTDAQIGNIKPNVIFTNRAGWRNYEALLANTLTK